MLRADHGSRSNDYPPVEQKHHIPDSNRETDQKTDNLLVHADVRKTTRANNRLKLAVPNAVSISLAIPAVHIYQY